ncbi:MAG TPA: hypothetical protein VLK03_02775 [Nocardioides sp.]|nr:hypothetical protein [Nocardioides sp.]
MRSTKMFVAATMLLAAAGTAPAQAADGARTLTGPSTGDADVFLTYVGCKGVFAPATAPQSRLNLGPYDAPLGRRSLGLVPSAPGSAAGPFARFGSLASIGSSLSVASTSGTTGVSHVMSITPTSPPGTAWSGRAEIAVPAGSWRGVSAEALTYDWTLVNLGTLAPVAPAGSATPAAFAAEHGDGSGFVVTGFGCDGSSFNLDAVRGSGASFDFEGIALTTTSSVDRPQAAAGDKVWISGRVTDANGRVTGDALVLESRRPGGAWAATEQHVLPDPDGTARVHVPVSETTEFRWHRPESQYADEGWSEPVTVTVEQPAPAPPSTPGAGTPGPGTSGPGTGGTETPAPETSAPQESGPEKSAPQKSAPEKTASGTK